MQGQQFYSLIGINDYNFKVNLRTEEFFAIFFFSVIWTYSQYQQLHSLIDWFIILRLCNTIKVISSMVSRPTCIHTVPGQAS